MRGNVTRAAVARRWLKGLAHDFRLIRYNRPVCSSSGARRLVLFGLQPADDERVMA